MHGCQDQGCKSRLGSSIEQAIDGGTGNELWRAGYGFDNEGAAGGYFGMALMTRAQSEPAPVSSHRGRPLLMPEAALARRARDRPSRVASGPWLMQPTTARSRRELPFSPGGPKGQADPKRPFAVD